MRESLPSGKRICFATVSCAQFGQGDSSIIHFSYIQGSFLNWCTNRHSSVSCGENNADTCYCDDYADDFCRFPLAQRLIRVVVVEIVVLVKITCPIFVKCYFFRNILLILNLHDLRSPKELLAGASAFR